MPSTSPKLLVLGTNGTPERVPQGVPRAPWAPGAHRGMPVGLQAMQQAGDFQHTAEDLLDEPAVHT